jgi:cell division protein FtsN
MGSSLAIAILTIAILLLAGAIGQAQTLPPPPNRAADLQTNSAPATSENSAQRETVFTVPTEQKAESKQYLVIVNGNSSYLLQQVQRVEASAAVQPRNGQDVIRVGIYRSTADAREIVAALSLQGIQANVTVAPTADSSDRYLVVIPGNAAELPKLAAQLAQSGVPATAIQQKTRPFGAHLAIGPFSSRGSAEEFNRQLQRSGWDSRVFYSR